ncbi:MAG TPA: cytochrome P450, partial [Mycobacterium sp.]|nr:cytochrome P450 [Mycobacterium sp.]
MREKLPPGPRLPSAVQAAAFVVYWPRFVAACRRRYGSVFTLRMSGLGTVVYLDDPADIKVVFAGDPSLYHAGEANSILAGLLGRSSVLVIDEDVHKYRRHLMLAPFQQKSVSRHVGLMADLAAEKEPPQPVLDLM